MTTRTRRRERAPRYLACGSNADGRLGIGPDDDDDDGGGGEELVPVVGLDDGALSIACGRAHALCVVSGGDVYGWGSNEAGQLGLGDDERPSAVRTPVRIPVSSTERGDDDDDVAERRLPSPSRSSALSRRVAVAAVGCGADHSLLISSATGRAYAFGDNAFGQLGTGDDAPRRAPTLIRRLDARLVAAAGGVGHSLVLSLDGVVYAFGRGAEGQLGDGVADRRDPDLDDDDETFVDVGRGDVRSTTSAPSARRGPRHRSLLPRPVRGRLRDDPVVLIAAGGHGSFAVTAKDGRAWRWGTLDDEEDVRRPTSSDEDGFVVAGYGRGEDEARSSSSSLPIPLPPPLGTPRRPRERSASDDAAAFEETNTTTSTTSRRSSSFDVTSRLVRRASAGLTGLSNDDDVDTPPVSPGSSLYLCPGAPTTRPRSADRSVVALSAGAAHVVCVTRDGEAWSVGAPGPQLGLGPASRHGRRAVDEEEEAGRVLLPGDVLVNGVACGARRTLLSTADGRVLSCGVSTVKHQQQEEEERSVPTFLRTEATTTTAVVDAAVCVGPGDWGRAAILDNLRRREEEDENDGRSSSSDHSFEDLAGHDDDDDADDDDVGYYGDFGPDASWKRRLSDATRRRLSDGTKAVGGALLTTGGAVLSGVVSAVRSGARQRPGPSAEHYDDHDHDDGRPVILSSNDEEDEDDHDQEPSSESTTDDDDDDEKPDSESAAGKTNKKKTVGRAYRHKDSFDGLAGTARRRIMLAAGSDFSVVHVVDDDDDDDE